MTELSYAITYPSEDYDSGIYEMILKVYEHHVFYWKIIGEMRIEFSLTKSLNGHLELSQNGLVTQSIVSSVEKTSIDVKFHDPSHFLDNAEIRYFWFINTVNYGQTPTGHFEYDFKPGEHDIECSVIADFDNSTFNYFKSVKSAIFAKKVLSNKQKEIPNFLSRIQPVIVHILSFINCIFDNQTSNCVSPTTSDA